jgi:hypothetical protein
LVISVKFRPKTGHERPEGEQRYSSTLSLTSAVDEGGWLTPRPGRFTSGKENRYPLHRRLGGPQGQSGRVRKISPPPEFDPRTVQPYYIHGYYLNISWTMRRDLPAGTCCCTAMNNAVQVSVSKHQMFYSDSCWRNAWVDMTHPLSAVIIYRVQGK